jgi:hypothetical protein
MRVAALVLLAGPALAQTAGWEDEAAALAGPLRACLAERPGAMVVEAWRDGPDRIVARLLLPGGAREDCSAEAASGAVTQRQPVPPGDVRPGEGLRAFMTERRCVDAWRLTDAAGRELGWLGYPGCG